MAQAGTVLADNRLGVLVAHEEAVEQGHEHLRGVRHHHHLRLGQGALHVVEVEDLVVGDETHFHGGAVCALLPAGEKQENTSGSRSEAVWIWPHSDVRAEDGLRPATVVDLHEGRGVCVAALCLQRLSNKNPNCLVNTIN